MGLFDSVGSLAGGIFGGILGGAGGGSRPAGSTTVVNNTTQDIPDWLKPYVTSNISSAQKAISGLGDTSALTNLAAPQIASTIHGDYLNSNPYLDQIYQHGADVIGRNVDSRFEASGRYGSGSHASSLAEPLAGLYGSLYGTNYQNERGRQVAAATNAPAFTSGAVTAALSPYSQFANLIPGLRTSSGSTSTPYFTNPMGNILGGALLGSQLLGGSGFGSLFGGGAGLGGAELLGADAGAADLLPLLVA